MLTSALCVLVFGVLAAATNRSSKVSVGNISNSNVAFYPNLIVNELFISNTCDYETVSVFDMLGQKLINVSAVQSGVSKVNVSKLQKGMWVVVVISLSKRL